MYILITGFLIFFFYINSENLVFKVVTLKYIPYSMVYSHYWFSQFLFNSNSESLVLHQYNTSG